MSARSGGGSRVVMVGLTVVLIATAFSATSAGVARAEEAARQPVPQPVGSLEVGDTLFWDGELYVERVLASNLVYAAFMNHPLKQTGVETCVTAEPCWAYSLAVADGARRLKVTIDTNQRSECYQMELWAPGTYDDPGARYHLGKLHCPDGVPGLFPQQWDMEALIEDPAAGEWVVRIVPLNVARWGFRLRAILEGEAPAETETVLPDLHLLPPYEFGFSAPVSPTSGLFPDNLNPQGPTSCTPDEIDEAHRETGNAPLRCLRFSAGIYNIGEGLLDLRLRDGGQVWQRIRRTDGELVDEREAGTWTSGGTHLHNHLQAWVDFKLFKVVEVPSHPDPQGKNLEAMPGGGHKLGWHDNDQRLYDWYRFDPWVGLAEFELCRSDDCIIVSPGWGDHYRWNRPGMFVDFPLDVAGSSDGNYLLRMIVDPGENIQESDEKNNVAYAWIQVAGDDVTICERGIGESAWDPRKELHELNFWLSTPGGTNADSPTGDCSSAVSVARTSEAR